MKKIISLYSFIFALFFITPNFTFAVEQNLISNPGMETAAGDVPLDWLTDQWGRNNASFTYENSGFESGHSLKVTVEQRKGGDAKWYFKPVQIKPNTEYTFSDTYKSNVRSSIVAMSLDASGNPTYYNIASVVPIANNWKTKTYTFKTLPNSSAVTVFHLIKKNGWLQIDNTNLIEKNPTPPPAQTEYIPNGSLETPSTDPNLPEAWNITMWGESSPVYEYLNTGHTGSKSIKLTMSDYISGDASYVYTPSIPLEAEKDYKFSAWYKTDVTPHAVLRYILPDGSENFLGLPDPLQKAADWQEYTATFSVPKGATGASVYLFLNQNGYLVTDDYSITDYRYQGFNRPLVTLSFDDGFEYNVDTALPVLAQYGIKATFCYATKYLEGFPDQIAKVQKIHSENHEACSHSVNHSDMISLDAASLDYELSHSKSFIESITQLPVSSFSSPLGSYNLNVKNDIMKYYKGHRTTDEGWNSKDTLDPSRLKVQNMQPTTTLAQFESWVNKAKKDNTWLILTYHAIVPSGATLEAYDTRKADFDAQMAWLSKAGITILPLNLALEEALGQ